MAATAAAAGRGASSMAAAGSASAAVSATSAVRYKNMFHGIIVVMRTEGFGALYAGQGWSTRSLVYFAQFEARLREVYTRDLHGRTFWR